MFVEQLRRAVEDAPRLELTKVSALLWKRDRSQIKDVDWSRLQHPLASGIRRSNGLGYRATDPGPSGRGRRRGRVPGARCSPPHAGPRGTRAIGSFETFAWQASRRLACG